MPSPQNLAVLGLYSSRAARHPLRDIQLAGEPGMDANLAEQAFHAERATRPAMMGTISLPMLTS